MLSSITLRGLAVVVLSVVLMVWTAGLLLYGVNAAVAAATGVLLLAIAWRANQTHWQDGGCKAAARAARHNAMILSLAWLWGSASMTSMYYLTDLSWYHAYQYGLYMLVPALLCVLYGRAVRREQDAARQAKLMQTGMGLLVLQILLMVVVLAVLVAQGKIGGTRPNWAANHIFLYGPITIAALSLLALVSQRRLLAGR